MNKYSFKLIGKKQHNPQQSGVIYNITSGIATSLVKGYNRNNRKFARFMRKSYNRMVDSFGFGVLATIIRSGLSDSLYQQCIIFAGL